MIPDAKCNLPQNIKLKLLKQLYGITELGCSWLNMYTSYLKKKLRLQEARGDLTFFYHTINDNLQGMLAVYCDQCLHACNENVIKFTNNI